jgi:hypothetical protein
MRIRAIHRRLTTFRLRTLCAPSALVCAALIAVSCFGQSFFFEAAAQTGGEGKSQASGAGDVPPGQSVAPIGNSGYMVPIPEIRMNRIKGTIRPTPTPPKEPSPGPGERLPARKQDLQPAERPLRYGWPDVNRLNLDRRQR